MAATLRRVPSKSAFRSLRTVYGCNPMGRPRGLAPARPLSKSPAVAVFKNSLRLIRLIDALTLDDAIVARGRFHHSSAFVHGVRNRFLDIYVFARLSHFAHPNEAHT